MTRSFSHAEISLDSNYSNRWRQWNRDERKRVQASRKYERPRGLVDMQNDRILPVQYECLNFQTLRDFALLSIKHRTLLPSVVDTIEQFANCALP